LDEVTTTHSTQVIELVNGTIERYQIRPEDFGLARAQLEDLRGGDAQENAKIAREILGGRPSAKGQIVALNAGCAIYVADRAYSLQEGVAKAETALASGRTLALLERVVELSNRP
jgi:anthranilate phosphoribosyltransferase